MQRERDKESLLLARENRKRERALRRQQEHELQRAMAQTAKQRREERRLKAAFAPLPDVLSEADVVLVVLDARDPAACRCAALERALIDCDKLPVLVLTKVDLVPKAAAEGTATPEAVACFLPLSGVLTRMRRICGRWRFVFPRC